MSINSKILIVAIAVGVILGGVSSFSLTTFAMIMITLLICALLWNSSYPREEKIFLLKLFIGAWLLRMVICLSIYIIAADGEGSLFNDDVGWPRAAWKMYLSWLDRFDFAQYLSQSITHPAKADEHYLIFLALLFSIFKTYTSLLAKYLNILLSCSTAIIIYDLTRQHFNRGTAKLASILTVFTPSLIIWSITGLKETSFIFLVVLCLWALMKFITTKRWYFLAITILPLFSIYSIREFFLPLIVIIIGVSLFVSWRAKLSQKMAFLLIGALSFSLLFVSPFGHRLRSVRTYGLNDLKRTHGAFVSSGGAVYKLFNDKFYDDSLYSVKDMAFYDILEWYSKGLIYLTFAPFPWKVNSITQLIFIPQVILWYAIFPFFAIGVICALRYRWQEIFPLLFFLFFVASVYGLTEGNIGTAVRHRDMFTPLCLIFAAVGMRKALGYRFLPAQKEKGYEDIQK